MDWQNLLPLVLAIVAIVPTILSLITQSNKDKRQATIDMNKAAADSMMAVIQPMRDEITRLQTRGLEMETQLIAKTTENGKLRIDLIDRENELHIMKASYDGLQMKYNLLAKSAEEGVVGVVKRKTKEDTVPIHVKDEIKANEDKKALIVQETEDEVKQLKSNSIANGTKKEGEQDAEQTS